MPSMVRIHYCPNPSNISDLQRLYCFFSSLVHQVNFGKKSGFWSWILAPTLAPDSTWNLKSATGFLIIF